MKGTAGRPVFGISVLVAVLLVMMALPAGAKSYRPFKGTMSGNEVSFGPVPANRCPEMAEAQLEVSWVASFTGFGYATHLGRFEATAAHCSNEATGIYMDGRLTMTAANGDVLVGTYTNGTSDPTGFPVIGFLDDVTFTNGGSGRFATASGYGTERGAVDLYTGEFTVVMEGFINYSR